ncbi:hypothetical protein Zmor_024528 [Zophobas morio]|uniref:Uncharacterized protein n=1 Tax=Zophobas morio TaxID=2755281 RepID=A0AA38M842_9CUCU|nr:hypothetical protein Zmor_024528 [Zophobas morio]
MSFSKKKKIVTCRRAIHRPHYFESDPNRRRHNTNQNKNRKNNRIHINSRSDEHKEIKVCPFLPPLAPIRSCVFVQRADLSSPGYVKNNVTQKNPAVVISGPRPTAMMSDFEHNNNNPRPILSARSEPRCCRMDAPGKIRGIAFAGFGRMALPFAIFDSGVSTRGPRVMYLFLNISKLLFPP